MSLKAYIESKISHFFLPLGRRNIILSYIDKSRLDGIKEASKISYLTLQELYRLGEVANAVKNIEGDIVEIGVSQGGSALVLSRNKGTKKLWLIDTFEGLPETTKEDGNSGFKKGEYNCSLEQVEKNLASEKNIFMLKGKFPEEINDFALPNKISLLHLDLDLYQPTKDALEILYDRVSSGGVIIVHDFSRSEPVKLALKEFFKDKPEIPFFVSANQAMIIKQGNKK